MMSLNASKSRREQESVTEDDLFIQVPYLPRCCRSSNSIDLVSGHSFIHLKALRDYHLCSATRPIQL